jgi:transcription-repair coupling factor (superfamily II helicase)
MKERELEDIMHRFVSGEVDVLVSTLIVESGPMSRTRTRCS